jgi:phosphomannomutase/phosphoglucomutase
LKQRRAVVLISFDQATLEAWFSHSSEIPGRYVLEQRLESKGVSRDQRVIAVGAGVADISASAAIAGTPWRVLFSPSEDQAAAAIAGVTGDYEILGLALLLAVIGVILVHQMSTRALRGDVSRILEGPGRGAAVMIRTPALLPLASPAHPRAGEYGHDLRIEGPATSGLPPHIFRAYDIRGVADTELDDETVYRIGSAIATIAGEMGEQTLAVGLRRPRQQRAHQGRARESHCCRPDATSSISAWCRRRCCTSPPRASKRAPVS